MKTALIFTENNDERLNVKEYYSVKAMKNGQYYQPLMKTDRTMYVEKTNETNCRDFVLWKDGKRIDSVSVSDDVIKVYVFHKPDRYEIESE